MENRTPLTNEDIDNIIGDIFEQGGDNLDDHAISNTEIAGG